MKRLNHSFIYPLRQLVLLFAFVYTSTCIQAQNPFAQFKVEHYDARSGMPNDFVMNTYQTMDGFIWMNSYSGFIRFDGKQFVTFNSSNTPAFKTDNSNSLFTESADSTLWFPVAGVGLVGYKNGVFTSYLTDTKDIFLRGKTAKGELLLSPPLGSVFDTDKNNSFIVFDPIKKTHTTIPLEKFRDYRQKTAAGDCSSCSEWFVSGGKVSHKEPNGQWREFGESEGIRQEVYIISHFKDSKARVWLTSSQGIYLYNGKAFVAFPGMEKVSIPTPNPSFAYIVEDAKKGIWVSVGNGVAYLPDGSDQFYRFPRQYLNIQTLHNLTVDRENNIWLASDRGLFKISSTKVVNYAEAEGISNNRVSGIAEISNRNLLVVSAMDSLYWLENGIIKPYQIRNRQAFKGFVNAIHTFKDAKGIVWIAHQYGVLKITPQGETNYDLNGQTRYVAEGLDGNIYFGVAYKGIATIDGKGKVRYLSFPKVDFSKIYVSAIHQLRDSSWLVTSYRTGAIIIDKSGQARSLDLFDGATSIQVFNAVEDKNGVLWFATGRGIVRWKNGKASLIGYPSGLKETSVFSILIDRVGHWWFPTNKGIFYAKAMQLEAYANKEISKIDWKHIDDGDGMNNRQCVGARHSIVDRNGLVYVPAIGGLVVVNPDNLQMNTIPPLIRVSSLHVDDTVYYAKAQIAPGDHRYIFDYSALSFISPDKNQIKFRLIGRDTGWIYSKGDNRAFYTNLPPGDYVFEVTASNNDGVWAKDVAKFEFSVAPFFYQTIWFKIFLGLILIGFIWLIVLWRTRAARAQNARLEAQVSQRTAELQTSLDRLQSAQKQLVQAEKMASLGELTAGIAHEIQNPLNFVNNFSEVSGELIDEMNGALEKGDLEDAKSIAADIQQNLSKIAHHGKRADNIVKGMLQHSRSGNGQKELADINALCDEYLRLSYHGLRAKDKQFQAQYETVFDTSITAVSILPQEIGRVVLNLINNAFYAVQARYKQVVASGKGESYIPKVSISTKLEANMISIEVKDNGNGIPAAIREKIFQPFFTTKPAGEGTGLGLSLSYDIITKGHGGQLTVESEEGVGTTFCILLPIT